MTCTIRALKENHIPVSTTHAVLDRGRSAKLPAWYTHRLQNTATTERPRTGEHVGTVPNDTHMHVHGCDGRDLLFPSPNRFNKDHPMHTRYRLDKDAL